LSFAAQLLIAGSVSWILPATGLIFPTPVLSGRRERAEIILYAIENTGSKKNAQELALFT